MSACIFFASDAPLPEVFPPPEYGYLAINVDDGTIDDGGADDNFALRTYPDSFLSVSYTHLTLPTKRIV